MASTDILNAITDSCGKRTLKFNSARRTQIVMKLNLLNNLINKLSVQKTVPNYLKLEL